MRFGLEGVKNVGAASVEAILRAREKGGPFKSLEDFCFRVDLREVGKRALECLIKAGALDPLGERNFLLQNLTRIMKLGGKQSKSFSLFLPSFPPATPEEKRKWEREVLGFSFEKVVLRLKENVDPDSFIKVLDFLFSLGGDSELVVIIGELALEFPGKRISLEHLSLLKEFGEIER
ncbi:MAG: hypothetical protein QXH03_00460 [Candidatus Bathyarchaeia archaeon]